MSQDLAKAFSMAIAIQMQIIGLLAASWVLGDWLNKSYPISINWYFITFGVGVFSILHTLLKMYQYIRKKL